VLVCCEVAAVHGETLSFGQSRMVWKLRSSPVSPVTLLRSSPNLGLSCSRLGNGNCKRIGLGPYPRIGNRPHYLLGDERFERGMTVQDRRKHIRVFHYFRAKLAKSGLPDGVEGQTENLSQGGAFVRTSAWRSFQTNDRAVLTLFLPPAFSGQDATIGLRGAAIVTRTDEEKEGVALQFVRSFRQFERIDDPDVPGKLRYKKLVHYLSLCGEMSRESFIKAYPTGFFVEKTQRILDRDVIFQFSTKSFDEQDVFDQLKADLAQPEALEARVIELHKRRAEGTVGVISIGRSPQNDVVLYNRMISKKHAYLDISQPARECHLVDLGSTNGTFLNGDKLDPHESFRLTDGAEISFGTQAKVVYFSAPTFYDFLLHVRTQSP
jgi:hypothetical protein